jgi:hypothetical protein
MKSNKEKKIKGSIHQTKMTYEESKEETPKKSQFL